MLRLVRLSMVIALCCGLIGCSGDDGEVGDPDAGLTDDVGGSGDAGDSGDAGGTEPEDEIGDPEDCDPELGGSTFIYVDPTYDGDDSDGSCQRPRTSLNRAVAQARQLDSKAVILGGDSTFRGSVTLQEGLSLLGGFDRAPDWSRNTDKVPRVLADTDQIDDDLIEAGDDLLLAPVRVIDAEQPTRVEHLILEAADVDDYESGSSAALVALRAPGLQLTDVELRAGAGGDGVDGQPGDDGPVLVDGEGEGETGHDQIDYSSTYHNHQCTDLFSDEDSFRIADVPPIAAGGVNPHCPDDDTAGGYGGRSDERDPDADRWETRHLPGGDSAAGLCENPYGDTDNALYDSDNGCGGRLFEDYVSEYYLEVPYDDQSGRDGLAYNERAADGAHGQTRGTFSDDRWVLKGHGEDGADGGGGRGGGGGAGGHARYWWGALDCNLGSGGGGGGAGGCGGEGAIGGSGGGWSVGLIAVDSAMMRLDGVEIITADAGDGGQGNQPGGQGQPGAEGGEPGDGAWWDHGDGTEGGDGNRGQDGGYSGDGAGGSSIGIYCPSEDTSVVIDGEWTVTVGQAGQSHGEYGPEGGSANQLGCQVFPADPEELEEFFPLLYDCPDDLDCECQQETVVVDCPSRPCQQLVGCQYNECVYAPTAVGDAFCTECIDGDCDDDSVRYCVEGDDDCPEAFCDPAPETDDGGETTFTDQVVNEHFYDCGTCELGHKTCYQGEFTCADLEVGGVSSEFAECDSTQSGTTYLFVDATYEGDDDEDGSRQAPFASLNTALEEAQRRDNPVLVIGGEPTFEETIQLRSGRSIVGGFDNHPTFYPEPVNRPTIQVGDDQIENQNLVGLDAEDITTLTQLQNLRVKLDDISEDHDGVSTTALVAENAPALHLIDVILEAGDGSDGDDDGGWSVGISAVGSTGLHLEDVTAIAGDGGDGLAGDGGSSIALYCPDSDTDVVADQLQLQHGTGGDGDQAQGLQRDNLDCNIQ